MGGNNKQEVKRDLTSQVCCSIFEFEKLYKQKFINIFVRNVPNVLEMDELFNDLHVNVHNEETSRVLSLISVIRHTKEPR